MDFALTDEQELLVESLKEYADRYFDDESVRQMYENILRGETLPSEITKKRTIEQAYRKKFLSCAYPIGHLLTREC